MKKICWLLLLLLLPCANAFAQDFEQDGIRYSISRDGVAVSGYTSELSPNLVIPSTVTYNGTSYAVKEIADKAFDDCQILESVSIPSSVTEIGVQAFAYCSHLSTAEIQEGVKYISSGSFVYCTMLANVALPSTLQHIGNQAFMHCDAFTAIYIPKNVSNISSNVFEYCSSVERIEVAEGNKTFDSRENCNAIINTSSNELVTGCQSTVIPSSVKGLGTDAFRGCTGLRNVNIPMGVTHIGVCAFADCNNLTSLELPSSLTSIDKFAFDHCKQIPFLIIPSSVNSIGDAAFYSCHFKYIAIKSEDINIGVSAFFCLNNQMNVILYGIPTHASGSFFSQNSVFYVPEALYEDAAAAFPNYQIRTFEPHGNDEAYATAVKSIEDAKSAADDEWASAMAEMEDYCMACDMEPFFSYCDKCKEITARHDQIQNVFDNLRAELEEQYKAGGALEYMVGYLAGELDSLVNGEDGTTTLDAVIADYQAHLEDIVFWHEKCQERFELVKKCTDRLIWVYDYTSTKVQKATDAVYPDWYYDCYGFHKYTLDLLWRAKYEHQSDEDFYRWYEAEADKQIAKIYEVESFIEYGFSIDDRINSPRHGITAIPVLMRNATDVSAFQFDVKLPDGWSFAMDETGDPLFEITGERTNEKRHSLSWSDKGDGVWRVVCTSMNNDSFTGRDGEVMTMYVCVPDDAEEGRYELQMSNIEISSSTNWHYTLDKCVQHPFDVVFYTYGDINEDGKITVSDVIATVNLILNIHTGGLNRLAADINGDHDITIIDAVAVINMVLAAPIKTPQRANRSGEEGWLSAEGCRVAPGQQFAMPIVLHSSDGEYTAMQFDLVLPAGLHLVDTAGDRRHQQATAQQADGSERIASLSTMGATYAGNGTDVMTLLLKADADFCGGDIRIEGAELVRPDLSTTKPVGITAAVAVEGTTGINVAQDTTQQQRIYDLQGKRDVGSRNGVVIMNGKKVIK